MKKGFQKFICAVLSAAFMISAVSAIPTVQASAKESVGNGVILSEDAIVLSENGTATFTAALGEGFDASRLACIVADPNVATVTPIAYNGNVAAFQVNYVGLGSTVAAVVHMDNPAVIAYTTINASSVIMNVPAKLGTDKKNYCELVSYEFVPYDFPYADYHDYKSTLKLQFKCTSYKDEDFRKWGCYGYFRDAAGNVIGKVRIYASAMSVGRVYKDECNVPVDAVSFTLEGFSN